MSLKPIVALDLGSTKVACAIALPHEHSAGFELLGTSLSAYPVLLESWLSDPLIVGRTIEQALEATAVRGDFHRAVVVTNLIVTRASSAQWSRVLDQLDSDDELYARALKARADMLVIEQASAEPSFTA